MHCCYTLYSSLWCIWHALCDSWEQIRYLRTVNDDDDGGDCGDDNVTMDACYDRGDTFRPKCFLNDEAP